MEGRGERSARECASLYCGRSDSAVLFDERLLKKGVVRDIFGKLANGVWGVWELCFLAAYILCGTVIAVLESEAVDEYSSRQLPCEASSCARLTCESEKLILIRRPRSETSWAFSDCSCLGMNGLHYYSPW